MRSDWPSLIKNKFKKNQRPAETVACNTWVYEMSQRTLWIGRMKVFFSKPFPPHFTHPAAQSTSKSKAWMCAHHMLVEIFISKLV